MPRKSLRALCVVAAAAAMALTHVPARGAVVPNTILASGFSGVNATTLAFAQGGCSSAFLSDPRNGLDALVLDVGPYVPRRSVNVRWSTPVPNPTGYLLASVYTAGANCTATAPKMLLGETGSATVAVPANGKWLIIGSQGRVNTTITLS